MWNALCYCGILCYIFPRVERALVLWNFVLNFSVCGTRSGVVLCFSACGMLFGIVLYLSACGKRSDIVLYFSACGKCSGVGLYFSTCGKRSGIVEFRVIFFCVWNALWYCGILCYNFLHVQRALVLWIFCYIFLRVESALVLWNFVLYLSVCVTRSGIVEFCSIFFHILKFLVEMIQIIFLHVCCIFHVVLKSLHSLQRLLVISVWNIFVRTLKKTVFCELIN